MPLKRECSSRRGRPGHTPKKHPHPNKCNACCQRFTTFLFSHVGLCVLVVGYSIIGAFTFKALEAPQEEKQAGQVIEMREEMVKRLWEITYSLNILYKENWTHTVTAEIRQFQSVLIAHVRDGYDGQGTGQQWSFSGAFLYSLTIITTVGYGSVAPKTYWGKLVTIVYAIIGIPLMFIFLTNIGDLLAKTFKYIYGWFCVCKSNEDKRRRRHPEHYRIHHIVLHDTTPNTHNSLNPSFPSKFGGPLPDEIKMEAIQEEISEENGYEKQRVKVPVILCLALITGYICGGAFLFSLWEGWDYLDGAYFCFVTLSTVGFGDLVPGDTVVSDAEQSQQTLVICSFYLLGGMALIAMCFNLVQEEVILKLRNFGRKLGILREREDTQA